MCKIFWFRLINVVALVLSLPVLAQEIREPEAATGLTEKQAVHGKKFMVVAANPYASQVGFDILANGGSAVDATIAIQLVLTLVEPQSSGIGGGAFILHWDKINKKLTTFDGRETAPAAATGELFFEHGKPVPWMKAVVGGRSVGVPGVLASLHLAHQKYGKLAWSRLFKPAISLAEKGFVVSPRLAKLVALKLNPGMTQLPAVHDYFFPNGQAIQAGQVLKNPALANVFRKLSTQGLEYFYQGELAKKMVDAVQHSSIAPGVLSLDDLKHYQAKERAAVCGQFHAFNVCGMGPPSSGGIAVIQQLGILSSFDLAALPISGVQNAHLFSQSSRLAFADRERYVADADYVDVPVSGLINTNYLKQRASLINQAKDLGKASAGVPEGRFGAINSEAYELPSTSHVSIVDSDGNAISMTSSIEMAFGSAVMVDGFLLNNQLTDFSLYPYVNGKPAINRIEAGKRPRSSMSPMMVFNQDGSLKLAIGSPGGSRIINYVSKTLLGVLAWQLDIQQAINLPNITNRNRVTTLEKGTVAELLKNGLEAKGHKVQVRDLNSGLHGIEVGQNILIGGADPRREGVVLAK